MSDKPISLKGYPLEVMGAVGMKVRVEQAEAHSRLVGIVITDTYDYNRMGSLLDKDQAEQVGRALLRLAGVDEVCEPR